MEVYFLKKLNLHQSDICGRNESQNIEGCSEQNDRKTLLIPPLYSFQPISLKFQPNLRPISSPINKIGPLQGPSSPDPEAHLLALFLSCLTWKACFLPFSSAWPTSRWTNEGLPHFLSCMKQVFLLSRLLPWTPLFSPVSRSPSPCSCCFVPREDPCFADFFSFPVLPACS